MMRDEVVTRRGWCTDAHFLDLVGATQLLPGPNSTELAIHLGWLRRGWAGLLVAGLSFIGPAALLTAACAWAYVRWGALPAATGALYGLKPVIVAVVAQAVWGLAQKAARTALLRVAFAACVVAVVAGADELVVLLAAGVSVVLARRLQGASTLALALPPALPLAASAAGGATAPTIFWLFLKIGSVLFGSGYVLLAFLRAELVLQRGWLTEAQLLDAVAVGQVTPGPVFSTATFVGWLLAGPSGALAATVGIFLPAFVLVAASGPLVPRLRASKVAGAFLDGVNVASLALMAVVAVQLGRASLVDLPTLAIGAAALGLLLRRRVNSSWLVLGGAAAGLALDAAGLVGAP